MKFIIVSAMSLTSLFFASTAMAAQPSTSQLAKLKLECVVSSIKRDGLQNLKIGSRVDLDTTSEDSSSLFLYEVDGQRPEVLAGFSIERAKENSKEITLSGSKGSILIGNKLSGSVTLNKVNKTVTVDINNRITIPGVGSDKAIIQFKAVKCRSKQ